MPNGSNPTTASDPTLVKAYPTKQFFIEMLIKDIELVRAIIDLIDNSIDGARRIRAGGNFAGLFVRLEVDGEHFKIADNCGGISIDLARNYAFCFGRPEGMQSTRHSVGQFGVGMKRALFKLGRHFWVESTTSSSHFVVEQNVDVWKADIHNWFFHFTDLREDLKNVQADQQGTIITVKNLHSTVADEFRLENFRNRLLSELEAAHQQTMGQGLAITLNQVPLSFRPAELLHSDELRPAYRELVLEERTPTPVTVKLYAGVSDSDPEAAGWNVFCNGRLVLEADQSLKTGWGEGSGTAIPKYHNQYARFRGYVFFDSDNAGLLPWNTTKTGVDEDSPIYRAVRQQMLSLTRPVIDFLNKLDAEKGLDQRPLELIVDAASKAILSDVQKAAVFTTPKPEIVITRQRDGGIQYRKPIEEIDRVKKSLKVYTNKEVGEKTFDYYLKMECEE